MHGRWATAVNSDSMALERAQSCSLIEPGAYTKHIQIRHPFKDLKRKFRGKQVYDWPAHL